MSSNVYPRCQYCGKVPDRGLYDGIRINGILFCQECTEGVSKQTQGSKLYEKFRMRIKEALNL